jgi:rhodanese-related sulfurtransferase
MNQMNDPSRRHSPHSPVVGALRRLLTTTALCLGLAATGAGAADSDPNVVSLDHARAKAELGSAMLIDIREPREQAGGVAAQAYLLPMSQLNQRLSEIPTDPGKPVFLICNSQNRSSAVLRALRERGGYTNVRYVEGGMSEWVRRGWPMVKPGA